MNPLLVTGAAVFIGARLVERLNQLRTPLVSVDKREHFETRAEHAGLQFGEIVDREDLGHWLGNSRNKVRAIVHIGACSKTTESDVAFLTRVNTQYSEMLWNAARARGIPFYYASSAATYGDGSLGYSDDEDSLFKLRP